MQDVNEPFLNEQWLLVPNPWYKGSNLNKPALNENRDLLKNMLNKINSGLQNDQWQTAKKRWPYPISECQPEDAQINPNYLLH